MKKSIQKFLSFKGHKIFYVQVDGVYWIALKPILDIFNIDADNHIKSLKNDAILGHERLKLTVDVVENGLIRGRTMTCLTEKYIYGWIFQLPSNNPKLVEYKRECYDLLYNYFHGTITNRKELLIERNKIDQEIYNTRSFLKQEEEFMNLEKLLLKRKELTHKLNTIDKEIVRSPELFDMLQDKLH
jgi:hypothetical protein